MIRIGDLQVDFARREIRQCNRAVRVGSRAFDILELLANARGALVSKDEIMRVVWPTTVVEENNLQVHVSALRKILGADSQLIRTVPGRGYQLLGIADNSRIAVSSNENRALAPPGELVGRAQPLNDVMAWLRRSSTMTLVGAGGIGKTRLALEAAQHMLPEFPDGVAVVSFASLTGECFVLDAVASALRAKPLGSAVCMDAIAQSVRGKRMLIVLDNCEHVIEAAANVALALRNVGQVVLATSREPLRIPDETVYAVPSLDVPADGARPDELRAAGAVQLFLARARAVEPAFNAGDNRLLQIAAVCRSLDGIPLAIELAAARAAILGVEALNHHLDDRLRMLTGGYRTALPRHQTMRATLEWSYRLLTEPECLVLRHLGVCVGGFTLETACFIAGKEGLSTQDASDALSGLILKSMVSVSGEGSRRRYRLLETTRQYALQRLDENGERAAAATAHAQYLLALLQEARLHWAERTDVTWMAVFSWELDNVRAALDWCLSAEGEASVGIALASAAVPFFFELSLVRECASRANQALVAYGQAQDCEVSVDALLRLQAALASGLVYTSGPVPETRIAWAKVYSDSVLAGNEEYEARALWGLWNAHQYGGEPNDALTMARRFSELASRTGDTTQRLLGMRIEAIALHYLGDQDEARKHLDAMLDVYDPSVHRWNAIGFRIEHRIVARATLARVLWVQGHVEKALEVAHAALAAAIDYDNQMVTCYVLVEAVIPLALLSNDLQEARDAIDTLNERASRMSFRIWVDCGACYEQCIAVMTSPGAFHSHTMLDAIARLKQTGFLAPLTFFLWIAGDALARQGDHDCALKMIEEALDHCHATGERWLYAELARMKGTILMAAGVGVRAGEWLAVALTTSRQQHAWSFEARANEAFAKWLSDRRNHGQDELLMHRARKEEATSVLSPLLVSLTGRSTPDPLRA